MSFVTKPEHMSSSVTETINSDEPPTLVGPSKKKERDVQSRSLGLTVLREEPFGFALGAKQSSISSSVGSGLPSIIPAMMSSITAAGMSWK
jgi:hypothetical protein